MQKIIYSLIAVVLGLATAFALYTKAVEVPASYIGSFTAPWFAEYSLFIAVILPPVVFRLRLHEIPFLRRVVLFVTLLPVIGAAAGVYVAVRYVLEQPNRTLVDLLIVIVGTAIYAMAVGVLLFWSLIDRD
jgi:hypothetical protein